MGAATAAVLLGPGLLSSPREAPTPEPSRDTAPPPAPRVWTGPAIGWEGNTFVPGPTRLLRLPPPTR